MNASMPLVMAQALEPFAPTSSVVHKIASKRCSAIAGSSADIEFMGIQLVVEMDYLGDVESILTASDGTDVTDAFKDWAKAEMKHRAHMAQLARSLP